MMVVFNAKPIKIDASLDGRAGTAVFNPYGYYVGFVLKTAQDERFTVFDHNGAPNVLQDVGSLDEAVDWALKTITPPEDPKNHINEFDRVYSTSR